VADIVGGNADGAIEPAAAAQIAAAAITAQLGRTGFADGISASLLVAETGKLSGRVFTPHARF
jgi:hypothetical protein